MLRIFGAPRKKATGTRTLYEACLAWVQQWFVSDVEWLQANVPRPIVRDIFL
jgi:hypothetical protein